MAALSSPRHKPPEKAPSAAVTTPDPSAPIPAPAEAKSVPLRELTGLLCLGAGTVGTLTVVGFLLGPLVSALLLCLLVTGAGVLLTTTEV